jgi:hypothetical protein
MQQLCDYPNWNHRYAAGTNPRPEWIARPVAEAVPIEGYWAKGKGRSSPSPVEVFAPAGIGTAHCANPFLRKTREK